MKIYVVPQDIIIIAMDAVGHPVLMEHNSQMFARWNNNKFLPKSKSELLMN